MEGGEEEGQLDASGSSQPLSYRSNLQRMTKRLQDPHTRLSICKKLRTRELLNGPVSFDHIVSKAEQERICSESSSEEAAYSFLEAFLKSKDDTKMGVLSDALERDEDGNVGGVKIHEFVHYILFDPNWEDEKEEDGRCCQMLDQMRAELINKVTPGLVCEEMLSAGMITRSENEKIKSTLDKDGERSAVALILSFLPRSKNWCSKFIKILINSKLHHLAKKLDPDKYQEYKKQADFEGNLSDSNDSESETLCGERIMTDDGAAVKGNSLHAENDIGNDLNSLSELSSKANLDYNKSTESKPDASKEMNITCVEYNNPSQPHSKFVTTSSLDSSPVASNTRSHRSPLLPCFDDPEKTTRNVTGIIMFDLSPVQATKQHEEPTVPHSDHLQSDVPARADQRIQSRQHKTSDHAQHKQQQHQEGIDHRQQREELKHQEQQKCLQGQLRKQEEQHKQQGTVRQRNSRDHRLNGEEPDFHQKTYTCSCGRQFNKRNDLQEHRGKCSINSKVNDVPAKKGNEVQRKVKFSHTEAIPPRQPHNFGFTSPQVQRFEKSQREADKAEGTIGFSVSLPKPSVKHTKPEAEGREKSDVTGVCPSRGFPCRVCEKRFETKDQLESHICSPEAKKDTSPKKALFCSNCKKRFGSKDQLDDHKCTQQISEIAKAPSKGFPCRKCDKRFESEDQFNEHLKVCSPISKKYESPRKELHCGRCGKEFRSKGSLDDHMCSQGVQNVESPKKGLPCPQCSRRFEDKFHLHEHFQKCPKVSQKIDSPNKGLSYRRSESKHMSNGQTCVQTIEHDSGYFSPSPTSHFGQKKKVDVTKPFSVYPCSCGKKFESPHILQKHKESGCRK